MTIVLCGFTSSLPVTQGFGVVVSDSGAGDVQDIGFDWTDALAAIGEGETIVGSEWALLFGSITINESGSAVGDLPGADFDDNETSVWFKGGVAGTTSKLTNTIITSGGRRISAVLTVLVDNPLNPQTVIPPRRTFLLLPTSDGMLGEIAKAFTVNVPTTIAVDFKNDLPLYGRVTQVVKFEIVAGTGGGVAFGVGVPEATLAKCRILPVFAGDYKAAVEVIYETPSGIEDHGDGIIDIKVKS